MKRVTLIVLISLLLPLHAENNGIILIANKSVPVDELSKTTISKIYLGKKTRWDNGSKIVPVIYEDKDVQKEFLSQYLNMKIRKFQIFWKKKIFIGKGKPPKSFRSEKDVLEYIAKTENSIGFVSNLEDTSEVKIMNVQ